MSKVSNAVVPCLDVSAGLSDASPIDWVDILHNNPVYSSIGIDRLKRQVELESCMRAEGLIRQDNMVRKAQERSTESMTSYGRVLLSDYTHRLALSVEKQLAVVKEGKPGCSNNSLRYIKDLESHVVAYITLKAVVDLISNDVTLQTLAKAIGVGLEDECRCRFFESKAKEAYKLAMLKEQYCTKLYRKRAAISAMMGAVLEGRYTGTPCPELKWECWSQSVRVGIGVKLLQLVVEATGIISIELSSHRAKKGQQLYYVRPRPELEAWIKHWVHRTGLMAPLYMPCVIPPRPYTTPCDGGYHTGLVKGVPLIKVVNDPGYVDAISRPENIERMSPVYEAVNLAQNTAWRVNTRVLDVMRELWEKSIAVDCLPRREDYPMPVCPKCLRPLEENVDHEGKHLCFLEDADTLRHWKRHAALVHVSNRAAFSKRLSIHRLLWVAGKYKDDPEIYFPYQLDFRGRLYATPQILNPQGADPAKGLLLFAHPKAIQSKEAADWLAIHVANTAGQDKLSFEDRIKWVEDNTPMIHAIAEDPIENRKLWADADSPFCFLAACFEWSEFKRQGYGYMSSIPVAQDGTCSGLQHYSAMLRDSVGGSAVNLVPADKPQDIYRVVADKVIEVLESYTVNSVSQEDFTLAQQWLCSGLINRKITKRSVMTLPYGSTLFSCKQYIREYVEEVREKSPEMVPWPLIREVMTVEEYNRTAYEEGGDTEVLVDPTAKACAWLGKIVWDCIHSTVIAASEVMDWLRGVADVVAGDAGRPLSWVTPSGFIVLQRYHQVKARRIKTRLAGELVYTSKTGAVHAVQKLLETSCGVVGKNGGQIAIDLTLQEETDQLDVKAQRQGVAPNFVHSLDASALVYAVIYANRHHRIEDFALIHDSFGTHAGGEGAGDSYRLAKAIRDSFVDMYEKNDVLASFEQQMEGAVSGDQLKKAFPGPSGHSPFPERPRKGSLDLQQVKESRYFFS